MHESSVCQNKNGGDRIDLQAGESVESLLQRCKEFCIEQGEGCAAVRMTQGKKDGVDYCNYEDQCNVEHRPDKKKKSVVYVKIVEPAAPVDPKPAQPHPSGFEIRDQIPYYKGQPICMHGFANNDRAASQICEILGLGSGGLLEHGKFKYDVDAVDMGVCYPMPAPKIPHCRGMGDKTEKCTAAHNNYNNLVGVKIHCDGNGGQSNKCGSDPMCPSGECATCCDVDGTCHDGDDDWCCNGKFYCSNDGEDYAKGKGGILCPKASEAVRVGDVADSGNSMNLFALCTMCTVSFGLGYFMNNRMQKKKYNLLEDGIEMQ